MKGTVQTEQRPASQTRTEREYVAPEVNIYETKDGYVLEADCHRYSAHNFYGEIKRYFRWLGGAPRPQREEPTAKP